QERLRNRGGRVAKTGDQSVGADARRGRTCTAGKDSEIDDVVHERSRLAQSREQQERDNQRCKPSYPGFPFWLPGQHRLYIQAVISISDLGRLSVYIQPPSQARCESQCPAIQTLGAHV